MQALHAVLPIDLPARGLLLLCLTLLGTLLVAEVTERRLKELRRWMTSLRSGIPSSWPRPPSRAQLGDDGSPSRLAGR